MGKKNKKCWKCNNYNCVCRHIVIASKMPIFIQKIYMGKNVIYANQSY